MPGGAPAATSRIHPCSGVWAEFDEPVEQWRGVPQAYAVDEFAAEGIMLEGWAGPPDMLALALPAAGDEHRRVMLNARNVAQAGLMIRDTSRGRFTASAGAPVIRYDVNGRDTQLARRARSRAPPSSSWRRARGASTSRSAARTRSRTPAEAARGSTREAARRSSGSARSTRSGTAAAGDGRRRRPAA